MPQLIMASASKAPYANKTLPAVGELRIGISIPGLKNFILFSIKRAAEACLIVS
jgi:hypothetical protein